MKMIHEGFFYFTSPSDVHAASSHYRLSLLINEKNGEIGVSNSTRKSGTAENVIPFSNIQKIKRSELRKADEVFWVKTEKIVFMIFLYPDEKGMCTSNGLSIFTGQGSLYFALDSGEHRTVRDKCLAVANRIARVYRGEVRQGSFSDVGKFLY